MKKLFTSDRFFLLMVLFAVVGETVYSVLRLIWNPSLVMPIAALLVRVLCVVALYGSYRKHSKNVMKGMMGALLMGQLLTGISLLQGYAGQILPEKILHPLYLLCTLVLFVNHFIINADRHSSPAMVSVNQIAVTALVLVNTVYAICIMVVHPIPLLIVAEILDIFGICGMACVIVCVESRLDAYRLNREAAGWTEEKGYPAGYVHGSEKK